MPRRLFLACLLPLLLLAGVLFALPVAAQDAAGQGGESETVSAQLPEGRESPRAAMFTFLTAMNAIEKGDTDTAAQWSVIYELFGEPTPDAELAHLLRRQAAKLKQTLDYIGKVESEELPATVPADTDYVVYFPQVYNQTHEEAVAAIGRDDLTIAFTRTPKGWAFADETLGELDELHKLLLDKRTQQYNEADANTEGQLLAGLMPDSLKRGELFGVYYWQWITLAGLILLAVILDQVLRTILRGVVARRVRKSGGTAEKEEINRTVRPFGFVLGGVFVMVGLPLVGLPDLAYRFLFAIAAVFTVFAGILAAFKVIDLISSIAESHAQKTKTKFDDILIPMIRKAAKIFAVAVGIVYGAQALNLPVVPLLGSLGIGSLAFAFAAKDTIENFFGSVAVILDRPFEVGDWVVIDDTEGTVEELGFRSTRIRTFYNSQITVPNATLVRATVDNYGRRKYRRWKTHIGVQYDTPPHLLIAFTEGIRELVRTHPFTRKDYYQVWMNQWSASSMDVLLYVFFEVPDWNTELRERERLFIDIVRLADKLGVQFAFPTQTVHLFKEEHAPKGQAHEPEHETPGTSTDRRSMVTGVRAAQELIKQQPWLKSTPGPVVFRKGMTEINLDEAGNETLVEKEDKTEPSGEIEDTQKPATS